MDLTMDMDFALFNSHPIFDGVRPMVGTTDACIFSAICIMFIFCYRNQGPNSAEVGGIHCRPARPVEGDEELGRWMDGAGNGFVYVSFGTVR